MLSKLPPMEFGHLHACILPIALSLVATTEKFHVGNTSAMNIVNLVWVARISRLLPMPSRGLAWGAGVMPTT